MSDEPEDERWREYRVTPRYLAGSSGCGDPGFEPVSHWPHHSFDDGPCQLLVTSPDHRIKIGWFGDDFDPWKITASADAVSPPAWEATFNHTFPPEIVAGLTAALAEDWEPESDRFLAEPSIYWADSVRPLLDAGWEDRWEPRHTAVHITSPDHQAGARIATRAYSGKDETVLLWSGPPGWGTRAEATFTANTPAHLVAATAAAFRDPAPVVRARHMLHRQVEHLVRLDPVNTPARTGPRAPTPLEAKQAAVTAAVQRATHPPGTRRALAARIRTTQASPDITAPAATPARPNPGATTRTAARPRR
ncbi:DUF317 domain-containing protein [Streptomyces cacaoi]